MTSRLPNLTLSLTLAAVSALSLFGDSAVLADPPEGDPPAQDTPVPAPPVKADDAAETEPGAEKDADKKPKPLTAPELLAKAAKQQGGAELADKDSLKSFRVEFVKAIFSIEKSQADGSSKRITVETDTGGLAISWMLPDSLRTDWTQDGELTTRAYYQPRNVNWLRDPNGTIFLRDEKYRADREQIARDRRMVRTLLDVVFLERLRLDGSVWTSVNAAFPVALSKDKRDANYIADPKKLKAIRRTPPGDSAEDASAVSMILWINKETGQVRGAYVHSRATGDDPLWFALSYHETFPTRHGTTARFPFAVSVYDDPKSKPTMRLKVSNIYVNDPTKVNAKTFSPK